MYTIVKEPLPGIDGSNVPAEGLVIPGPLQTPPGVEEIKVSIGSVSQNGPTGQIEASQQTKVYCVHAFMFTASMRPFLLALLFGFCAPTAKISPLELTLTS